MKDISAWVLIALLMTTSLFFACSDKDNGVKEKNVVEKISDDAAKKISDKILEPVENARDVKVMEDKRLQELEKAMVE